MPFQFRIHLEAELRRILGDTEVLVPTPVVEELRLLASHNREAKAALRLAGKYRTIQGHGSADDALLDLAPALHAIVVTNDKPLLDRLEAAGVPRAYLRSRNHLVVEGL